ncbi:MAG: hypothetical protein HY363_00725 [Candidatus Aenigmarchaeota archaeon]|nr:hypothetical protein [Candidatus Aenigmarchaeota archaeon]
MGRIRSIVTRLVKNPIKIAAKTMLAAHLTFFSGALISNNIFSYEKKTAVLISDYSFGGSHNIQSIIAAAMLYPPITLYENISGAHAVWYLHATKSDLEAVVQDESVQNIATIGHGAKGMWHASDGMVWNFDVREMMTHEKIGYWLQVSCGQEIGVELGSGLMPDENLHYYAGIWQNPLAIYFDAIRGFPLLYGERSPDEGLDYILLGRFLGEDTLRKISQKTYQG